MPFPCSVSPTVITPCAPFHVRASEVSLSRARVSRRHHLSLIPGGGRGCQRVWGSRPVTWGPRAENRAVTPLVPGSDMGAHRAALLPETPHLALLRPLGAMVAQPWGHVCPSSEGLVVASPPKPTAGAGRWVCVWGQHYVHGDSGMCVGTAAHVHGTVDVCMETVTCVHGDSWHLHGDSMCVHGDSCCVCTGQPRRAQDSGCMHGDSCPRYRDRQCVHGHSCVRHRDSQYVHGDSVGRGWGVHGGDAVAGAAVGAGQEECPCPARERCCCLGVTLRDAGGSGRRAWSLLLAQGVDTHPA